MVSKRRPKQHRKPRLNKLGFSIWDELMSDPINPVKEEIISSHLIHVYQGLDSLIHDAAPPLNAWCDISDAINILSALVDTGYLNDEDGQITKAKNAMGEAGARHMETGVLRLSEEGIQILKAVLEDYVSVVKSISERQYIRACRNAQNQLNKIAKGNRVIAL